MAPDGIPVTLLSTKERNGNIQTFKIEDYATNTYTLEQFAALQEAGMVFLPCAGTREKGQAGRYGTIGGYWSSTTSGQTNVRGFFFFSARVDAFSWPMRSLGYSVRLVQDYVEPTYTDLPATNSAKGNNTATKILRDGQVIILRDGKEYTILGQNIQ